MMLLLKKDGIQDFEWINLTHWIVICKKINNNLGSYQTNYNKCNLLNWEKVTIFG